MSKSKLIERLENLTPEEQALVSKLLGIAEEAEVAAPKKTSKRKQKRKSEKEPPQTQPRKKVIVEDENDLDEQDNEPRVQAGGRARRVKTRREARAEGSVKRHNGVKGRSKGRQARVEPVDLSGNRPNRFIKMDAYNAERGDTKIDAILNKGRRPTKRRDAADMIEVECTRCSDIWEVPSTFVYRDDDGINFICDACRGRGAK